MYDIDKYWAYFLGFFWGDGSVRSGAVIGILHSDGIEIENIFSRCVPYKKRLYLPKNRTKEQSFYTFRSRDFLKFLLENDFWDKSVLSPSKILGLIPRDVHRYFWLGYVDADGCFSKRKNKSGGCFSLAGSFSQKWDDFSNLLVELEIENYSYFQKDYGKGASSVYEIKYGADLIKIGEYLYPNGYEFSLKRKYDRYLMIKESIPKQSSKWKGVSFHQGESRWRASAPPRIHLGWFDTEEQAHEVRVKYLIQKDASKTPET